jgi:hypothetical protein
MPGKRGIGPSINHIVVHVLELGFTRERLGLRRQTGNCRPVKRGKIKNGEAPTTSSLKGAYAGEGSITGEREIEREIYY